MRVRRDTVILERRFVPKDAVIIKEGEYGAQAFLVQSGEVIVTVMHEGQELELSRLGTGQIFGEMALIFDGPRTASVRATKDCNLIIITRQQFLDKLGKTDSTIKAVVNMLAKRMVNANNTLLNKKADIQSMRDASRAIYQNIAASLSGMRLRKFQSNVLPKLDALLAALKDFEEEFGKDEEKP